VLHSSTLTRSCAPFPPQPAAGWGGHSDGAASSEGLQSLRMLMGGLTDPVAQRVEALKSGIHSFLAQKDRVSEGSGMSESGGGRGGGSRSRAG
jgi:hypothetical protein